MNQDEKCKCPYCGASMKQWKQSLTAGLVNNLIKLKHAVIAHDRNEIHLMKDMSLSKNEYNNFQKLRYHGLVAKVKGKSGYWLITRRGNEFLCGKLQIPRVVKTFRNKIVEHGEELVYIEDIIDSTPFFESRDNIQYDIFDGDKN